MLGQRPCRSGSPHAVRGIVQLFPGSWGRSADGACAEGVREDNAIETHATLSDISARFIPPHSLSVDIVVPSVLNTRHKKIALQTNAAAWCRNGVCLQRLAVAAVCGQQRRQTRY